MLTICTQSHGVANNHAVDNKDSEGISPRVVGGIVIGLCIGMDVRGVAHTEFLRTHSRNMR
jgi:hypothetical protein